jgi:integrase
VLPPFRDPSGRQRKRSARTLAEARTLKAALTADVKRANPAAGLRLGRTVAASKVKETNALTEDEVVRVLADVPVAQRELATFLVQTGLRISEALALTKADIDFGRRRLSVSKRLYEGQLDAPKSRHGVRQVPLSPELARSLWTRLATEAADALVFPGVGGKPLDRTHLYRIVQAAGDRAGIAWPVGLHALRHSCASIMFRRGVPKEAIRRMLGHHSWEFTAGTYLHLDDDDLPDAAVVGDLVAHKIEADALSELVGRRAQKRAPRRPAGAAAGDNPLSSKEVPREP